MNHIETRWKSGSELKCLQNVDFAAKASLIIGDELELVAELHDGHRGEHALGVLSP